MNKYKLLVAVAVAGLLGVSARAVVVSYEPVSIKAIILVQTNNTYNAGDTVTTYHVTKIKVTNKDILKLIEPEFATNSPSGYTNFPSGFPVGSQLVIDYFWDGEFYVLDKAGNVILDVYTENDDFELYIDYNNYVYTGSETDTGTVDKYSDNYSTIGEFFYEDATGANTFDVYGLARVKDTENHITSIYSQSFKMTATGNGTLDDSDAVISGSLSGSGKNLD